MMCLCCLFCRSQRPLCPHLHGDPRSTLQVGGSATILQVGDGITTLQVGDSATILLVHDGIMTLPADDGGTAWVGAASFALIDLMYLG